MNSVANDPDCSTLSFHCCHNWGESWLDIKHWLVPLFKFLEIVTLPPPSIFGGMRTAELILLKFQDSLKYLSDLHETLQRETHPCSYSLNVFLACNLVVSLGHVSLHTLILEHLPTVLIASPTIFFTSLSLIFYCPKNFIFSWPFQSSLHFWYFTF